MTRSELWIVGSPGLYQVQKKGWFGRWLDLDKQGKVIRDWGIYGLIEAQGYATREEAVKAMCQFTLLQEKN